LKTLHIALIEEITNLEDAAENAMLICGNFGVLHARSTTLFNHGITFENSITFEQTSRTEGKIVSDSPHAGYLEYGNPYAGAYIEQTPHVVYFANTGQFRWVDHTIGHGPLPFIAEAGEYAADLLPEVFDDQLGKLER
jgi:hypothetical protein